MTQALDLTRRHFLQDCRIGLGGMALASLLAGENERASAAERSVGGDPLALRPTHFPPKAKNVIFLFMAGGPSQFELFEPKEKLQELGGQQIPQSFVANKRFAFIKQDAKLLGCVRKFAKHGESGQVISECLPHLQTVADDICTLRAMKTDVFNHGPAKFFMNTGSPLFGRPSMGAWITYVIGSASRDLPGFVVLQSGPRGPRGGAPNWGSGFLPTTYQGVPFRSTGAPILNLDSPPGIARDDQRRFVEAVNDFNRLRLAETGDGEIATRIAGYEMAFRMQASAPELMDLSAESQQTLDLYGAKAGQPSFAMNCLLARRLVERGVRFVQLYHTDWDHHGNKGTELGESLDMICGDHHIESFTMWLAGGGVKPGLSLGQTDDIGYYGVEDVVHVHDLHATILHLMGLDHLRLTFRFQGRDFRLTDVAGKVVNKMLA